MKKLFTLIMMLAATLSMQAQDTWTVAGETAITGISWAPSEAANDMTSADGITYTLVKEHMMMQAMVTKLSRTTRGTKLILLTMHYSLSTRMLNTKSPSPSTPSLSK